MAIRSRIPLGTAGMIAALCVASAMVGCGVKAEQTYVSAPKPVAVSLDGSEVKILEARFESADIEFEQTELGELRIEGGLYCEASDQHAADIHVSQLDLQVTHGKVTLLNIPASPEDFKHRAKLKISVPRGVNLRVIQGEGSVVGDFALPLMTDIELGTGNVDLRLPRDSSAFVLAQINIASPEDFAVLDFDRIAGEPTRQLTHVYFEGQIGTPLQLVGSRLEVRVNAGSCRIRGREATPATP